MSEPTTEAGRALLAELSENPLQGARYARDVVLLRLPAIEQEARGKALADVWSAVDDLGVYPARYGGALYTDPVSRELTEAAILVIEQEAADAARKAAIAAVEAVRDSDWRDCPGSCHDFTVDAVIEAIQQSGADR